MSQPGTLPLMTVDEYLAFERATDRRHVYLDGLVFPIEEGPPPKVDVPANHDWIRDNLLSRLAEFGCRRLSASTRVSFGPIPKIGTAREDDLAIPDVVLCGEPEYHDVMRDVILNPTAIFEVLSPSTEALDRGDKFHGYQQQNPTLMDYVLISQHEPVVELFSRSSDGCWNYRSFTDINAKVRVPSIGHELKLADLYDHVTFLESEES